MMDTCTALLASYEREMSAICVQRVDDSICNSQGAKCNKYDKQTPLSLFSTTHVSRTKSGQETVC